MCSFGLTRSNRKWFSIYNSWDIFICWPKIYIWVYFHLYWMFWSTFNYNVFVYDDHVQLFIWIYMYLCSHHRKTNLRPFRPSVHSCIYIFVISHLKAYIKRAMTKENWIKMSTNKMNLLSLFLSLFLTLNPTSAQLRRKLPKIEQIVRNAFGQKIQQSQVTFPPFSVSFPWLFCQCKIF